MRITLVLALTAVAVHSASVFSRAEFEKEISSRLNLDNFHKAMAQLNEEVKQQVASEQEEVKELLANSAPISEAKAEEERKEEAVNAEISDDLFEGDILLTDEQLAAMMGNGTDRFKRQAYTYGYPANIWGSTKPVPFTFDGSVSEQVKGVFREAARFWGENTCIRFQENGAGNNKIMVASRGGCFSNIGMTGGTQLLSLNNEGCNIFSVASHELEHALGVNHEQSRADRDQYIDINTNNIQSGAVGNFDRVSEQTTSNFSVPYEFGSNMHYTPDAFAKNFAIPSIVAKGPYKEYQESMRGHMPSFYDVLLVNKYYKCDQRCAGKQNFCQNGGYLNVNTCNTCVCPEGWGGRDCTQKPDGCVVELTATNTFQSKSITLNGAPTIRPTSCAYIINAPAGRRIEVKFDGLWGGWGQGCRTGGFEVKTKKDLRPRGFRYCGEKPKIASLWSETNRLPIFVFKTDQSSMRADIQFRYA